MLCVGLYRLLEPMESEKRYVATSPSADVVLLPSDKVSDTETWFSYGTIMTMHFVTGLRPGTV